MWIASHHTAGINSPEPSRGDFTPHFFFFFPFSYFGLGPSCCAQTSTHCPLLQSPLPTLVIHFPRPLAERGGCSRRRAPATSPPPAAVLICLFSACPPPPLLLLFLRLLLLPLLPPSYSPSQCECVLKCLPALCNIERPTAY